MTCTRRHRADDPALGTPLCARCFDYGGAIAWNHHASELWRRTTIRIYRELAAQLGRSEATVKRQVRLSYVKVAEWQRRGLIHFHAAIRLDARPERDDDPEHAPAPEGYTLDMLDAALRAAVTRVSVPYPVELSTRSVCLTDHIRSLHKTTPNRTAPSSHLNGPSIDTATCVASSRYSATGASSHNANLIDDPRDSGGSWDGQSRPRGGGRGGQGPASDEGGCAEGTLDGTDRHIGQTGNRGSGSHPAALP